MQPGLASGSLRRGRDRDKPAASGLPHDADSIRIHTAAGIAAMKSNAGSVFESFLDLVGRPHKRVVLPSREWV